MDDMTITKNFIFVYAIFTVLLMSFGLTNNTIVPNNIDLPNNSGLGFILDFGGSIFAFFFNILFYTTDNWILNFIIWAYRSLMILEIIIYTKRVIHPTTT
jgi:hypothetical protein